MNWLNFSQDLINEQIPFAIATVFEYPTNERVSADQKPCKCVPPSPWGMLFVKHKVFSW